MDQKIGFLFPGQGAQYIGMGEDIYKKFDCAKNVFDHASNITGENLVQLCFDGPEEKLTDTMLCQIAIFTVSVASLRAFQSCLEDENIELVPTAVAGLSLGEYASLVFAGCFSFEEGIKLVSTRGKYMKEAAIKNEGAMSSVIGLEIDKVKNICEEAEVEIANLNCPGQIVISGYKDNIKEANKLAEEFGAKRVIPLKVSGAYHSRLMDSAREELKLDIEKINFNPPNTLFVSNVTGCYHILPEEIKENLIKQVSSSVYWEKSMRLMLNTGITRFYEIGPGKVLRGLMRRIERSVEVKNVETTTDIEGAIREIKEE